MNVHGNGSSWRFTAFEGCPSFYTNTPPSWFHRFMQKWLLGFRWTREN